MSRTVRNKKPSIHSWNVEFKKYFKNPTYDCSFENGILIYTYREKNQQELSFDANYSTRDGNHRVKPNWWFRHQDVKAIRNKAKQEINHYINNNEYEVMIPHKNIFDVWWNWD